MSVLARARGRARSRILRRRHAEGLGPRGTFIPHREPAEADRGAPGLRSRFDEAAPCFARVLALVEGHGAAYARFGGAPPAPRFEQDWFPGLDAAVLYALVRAEAPARMVEIGSGHSTRIAARAIADGGLETDLLAIDPEPRASLANLAVRWRAERLQESDPGLAHTLAASDILFVDSSHVLVAGSDVACLLTDWLPRLAPGVLVHVHDVFLPDPYPASWAWRGYNEQQAVAGLLMGSFELVFASSFVRNHAPALLGPVARALPLLPGAFETSLWLRRL